MDELQKDAARLGTIATIFIWVGWLAVLYSFIAGILWWIDLAQREAFNFLEAFAISAAAIGVPLFLALIVAAAGHALRLFALVRLRPAAVRPLRRPGERTHDHPTPDRARRCRPPRHRMLDRRGG